MAGWSEDCSDPARVASIKIPENLWFSTYIDSFSRNHRNDPSNYDMANHIFIALYPALPEG
ncbi:MAG: hypothetical protein VSS75_011165 [Candidatus Parabeggiatoa sp.]|nr:hypothetical protein [Candidatus Parabeggiatoa sp.]